MKKILITGLAMFLLFNTLMAQKCKPTHSEYDDFTEQKKEFYGNVLGNSSLMDGITSSVSVFVVKIGETDKKLHIEYSAIMDKEEYKTSQDSWMGKVEETSNTIFFSTNGKPLKFEITETRLESKELLGDYHIKINLTCDLSKELYKSICQVSLDKIRVEMGNRQLDYKISKKKSQKFISRIKCAN